MDPLKLRTDLPLLDIVLLDNVHRPTLRRTDSFKSPWAPLYWIERGLPVSVRCTINRNGCLGCLSTRCDLIMRRPRDHYIPGYKLFRSVPSPFAAEPQDDFGSEISIVPLKEEYARWDVVRLCHATGRNRRISCRKMANEATRRVAKKMKKTMITSIRRKKFTAQMWRYQNLLLVRSSTKFYIYSDSYISSTRPASMANE